MIDNSAKRILLVDDLEDNRFIVHLYLKKLNYTIDDAANGEIAFSKFLTEDYDLILMDIQMPIMSGFESTRLIRSHERDNNLQPVPILALTAYISDDCLTQASDAGFTTYLSKPIKKKSLITAVEKHLTGDD